MEDDPTLGAWDEGAVDATVNDADETPPEEATSEELFIRMVRRSYLPDGADLYPWQVEALRVLWMHKDGIWYHVLQSAIGDGKTVVAIGEVLAQCWAHRTITYKALYAVPFRRLAREKGDEFRDTFTRLRGTTPRPNEVRVVEGKRPVRDITLTRVVIGTFERIL
jgi:replicative superfamily II helicase